MLYTNAPRNYYPEAVNASVPPAGYAKPQAHAIFYTQSFTTQQKTDLAKFTSASVNFGNNALLTGAGATAMTDILAINPSIELYLYFMTAEVNSANEDYGGTYGNSYQEVRDNNWWLRNVAGQRLRSYTDNDITHPRGAFNDRGAWASGQTYVQYVDMVTHLGVEYWCTTGHTSGGSFSAGNWSTYIGYIAANYSLSLPDNPEALSWQQWKARQTNQLLNAGFTGWTGIYHDSFSYSSDSFSANWLADGTNRLMGTDTGAKRAAEAAHAEYMTELRALRGSSFGLLANTPPQGAGAPWGRATEFLVTQGMGAAHVDGSLAESVCGRCLSSFPLSVAGVSDFGDNTVMATWAVKAANVRTPAASRSVLGTKIRTATEYATVRLGTALALMQDARVAVNVQSDNYQPSTVYWFDEWDAELGTAIDPKRSTWGSTAELWVRRFQNGVVLLNSTKLATSVTRIAAASNGVSLPQATINVDSTAAFQSSGQAYVATNLGRQLVSFTGKTGTTLTGCTGGTGTMSTNNELYVVWQTGVSYTKGQVVFDGTLIYVCDIAHTSGVFATDLAAGRWYQQSSSGRPAYMPGAAITVDNTVIPYGVYKRISGTQDPTWNSGATVNGSFSLPAWDAIILLCVTPGVHS
jgi:hypothetical protein